MEYTSSYHLPQWAMTDRIQMEDFNDMTGKLDHALTENAEAHQAMTRRINQCGNCKIWVTSYVGTGQCGQDHPNTLTFPERPLLAFIFTHDGSVMRLVPKNDTYVYYMDGNNSLMKWSGSSVSWYLPAANNAYGQMNQKDVQYMVIAFFKAD